MSRGILATITADRGDLDLRFLGEMPLDDARDWLTGLPGVGPKTAERLRRLGVATIGDLAALPLDVLSRAVGTASGAHLHALAQGRDERPVVADATPKSISHEETFIEDIDRRDTLDVHVLRMADAVAERARRHRLPGRTVTIKVRFGDFATVTRSQTVGRPIATGVGIAEIARRLLDDVDHRRGIRLLGVGITNLGEAPSEQLQLLDLDAPSAPEGVAADVGHTTDRAAWRAVTEAMDAVRERFGPASVVPAALAPDPADGDDSGSSRPGRFVPGAQQWGPVDPDVRPGSETSEVSVASGTGVVGGGDDAPGDGRDDDPGVDVGDDVAG